MGVNQRQADMKFRHCSKNVNVKALVPIMGLLCDCENFADLLPLFPALVASEIFQFHEACHSAAGIADNNL